MASTGDKGATLEPGAARTPAEYVALLRRLKERSGLTYRQLEVRAAERGDVLARSTLADVLRRDALPRAEVVSALVRACGVDGEERAGWLAARERLVAVSVSTAAGAGAGLGSDVGVGSGSGSGSDGGFGSDGGSGSGSGADAGSGSGSEARPGPAGSGPGSSPGSGSAPAAGHPHEDRSAPRARKLGALPRTAPLVAVASLAAVALLAVGAVVLLPTDGDGPDASLGPGPAPGVTRIRPASAPELCLTEGNVRSERGEYKTVAVQRPCAQAVPPTTSLVRSEGGRYRVQWDHPSNGKGCLTLLGEGEFRNLLEPWNDCAVPGTAQLFRIERAEGAPGWRLRPEGDPTLCVGIRGGADMAGAAAVEPCATAPDGGGTAARQRFLIGR
ncbi:helix-turn-helix transcriptional regulator [Streptomyces griseoviridis]|uniref:XRE family transcriptional regulator n=1 Tax=Streptomyces griseoviridis TaxID=45398 RepID=A0A918L8A9_STRGD|nr:helix-turn-helix transcriptional regulator [Streptomyces niveoruber]GGS19367.1 hypothetical protein GCM10010238_04400 [Streptomyces niveoruber]